MNTPLFDFDPDLVSIQRKRPSTTQGSVIVSYDGTELGHYGDDIKLIKEGVHRGQYHGHDDAHWMAVAQRQAIAQGLVCDDDENKCSECRCTYEDGGDGYNGMCPSCADAAEEQTFKINVAMNIRAYGVVEVKAATIEDAQSQMTHQFIADNFEPHGCGSEDYDMTNPEQVWLGEWEAEDGEGGELEIDLPDPDEERKALSAGGVRAINAILDSEDMNVSSDVGDALVDIVQNEPDEERKAVNVDLYLGAGVVAAVDEPDNIALENALGNGEGEHYELTFSTERDAQEARYMLGRADGYDRWLTRLRQPKNADDSRSRRGAPY